MSVEYVTSNIVLTEEIIPEIAKQDILGFDIETRGIDPITSQILLLQLSTPKNEYVLDARKLDLTQLFQVLEQTNPLLVGHNIKFDLSFLLSQYGFTPTRLFDTMLAYGILTNGIESPFVSLRQLLIDYFDVYLNKSVRDTFEHTFGDISDAQIEYAAADVRHLIPLLNTLSDKLVDDGLVDVAKLEFGVLPAVVDIELSGISFDTDKWGGAIDSSVNDLSVLELKIAKIIGDDTYIQSSFFNSPRLSVNLRSTQQVKKLLHQFGFDVDSTKAAVLSKIAHPFAVEILKHRKLTKLISTYGNSFLELVRDDERIHASFDQLGTRSGRFSSSKPNLQNIPADEIYRSCFIADDGNILITADYKQIEMKIAAVMSGEQHMLDEYKKKDADLHRLTGSRIYEVALENVTPKQRHNGKTCNFGTIYGISKYGLYHQFGIPLREGEFLLNSFRGIYPTLFSYMQRQSNMGVKEGYNTTKLGRRRYYELPPLDDPNYGKIVSSIRRAASNHSIQGTAGDIMKLALIKVHNDIKPYGAHIVNTIHDEMVVEAPMSETSSVVAKVYLGMESAAAEIMGSELTWDVSLVVGDYWKKA